MEQQPKTTKEFNAEAYSAAEKWFEIHAKQRMDLFRFYAAILTAMVAINGLVLREEMWVVASIIAIVSIGICLTFKALDKRTSQLVKVGESAMSKELVKLEIENSSVHFINHSEPKAKGAISYSKAISFLSFLFICFFVASLSIALYALVKPHAC